MLFCPLQKCMKVYCFCFSSKQTVVLIRDTKHVCLFLSHVKFDIWGSFHSKNSFRGSSLFVIPASRLLVSEIPNFHLRILSFILHIFSALGIILNFIFKRYGILSYIFFKFHLWPDAPIILEFLPEYSAAMSQIGSGSILTNLESYKISGDFNKGRDHSGTRSLTT